MKIASAGSHFLTRDEMSHEFRLADFANASTELELEPQHLKHLFSALLRAENPRSLRVLFWLLLQTVAAKPELLAKLNEDWLPTEPDLAQLLEDAGKDGTWAVLSLDGLEGRLERLWQLSDDAGLGHLVQSSDPWEIIAIAPMAALYAERQLDELIAAVAQGRQWKDPGEILSPDGEQEFDLEALIGLAQARMVKTKGGEALNLVVLRLMNHVDRVN